MNPDWKQQRWPVWLLALAAYPFAAGAAFVNLFFLFLMLQAVGIAALSTLQATLGGLVLGIPFAWIIARWLRRTIDAAETALDEEQGISDDTAPGSQPGPQ